MAERAQKAVKKSEAKKASRISHTQNAELFQSVDSPVNRILYLQRTSGNRAVQNLIKSGAFQAKLRIGRPNDIYEQEADRVADSVMKMPEPQAVINSDGGHLVRRACMGCEEELRRQPEEGPIQPRPISEQITPLAQRQMNEECESVQTERHPGGNQEVPPAPESQIQSLSGRGQTLSESVRAFFEPRFAYNFSHVRVHTGSGAAEAARSVNAKAFTVGNEVMFGAGQYSPGTPGGRHLLAHELTHVIQQQGGKQRIQRSEYPASVKDEAQKIRYLLGLHFVEDKDWMKVKVRKEPYLRREVAIAFTKMQKAAEKEGHKLKLVSARRSFERQLEGWNNRMKFTGIVSFGEFKYKESPVKEKCDCPESVKCICPPNISSCEGILDETARQKLEWFTANKKQEDCWKNRLSSDDKVKEILKGYAAPGTSRHHWGTEIDLNSVTAKYWEESPLIEAYGWLRNNASRFGFYQPYTSRTARGKGYPEEKWHWSYRAISRPLLGEYRKLLTGANKTKLEKILEDANIKGDELKAILYLYEEYVESVAWSLSLPAPVPSAPSPPQSKSTKPSTRPRERVPSNEGWGCPVSAPQPSGQLGIQKLLNLWNPFF